MAGGKDLTYRIGIDASDATGSLQKFGSAVKGTMRQVEDEMSESATAGLKLSTALDRLSGQMREDFNSAAIAAEEMGRALAAVGSKLDVADVVPQLQKMGLSFDEITQDADLLAHSLAQLDDVKATGLKDLDAIAPGLGSKLDKVNSSADQTKSVMANLAGNAAQDLGAVSGIAGSAGVALGQLAEYATEGNISMKALAGLAAPMVGVALATELIGKGMESIAAAKAFDAKRVEDWVEALQQGEDVATALADQLVEAGKAEVVTEGLFGNRWFSRIDDAKYAIANVGLSFDTFSEIVEGGADAIGRWEREALAQGKSAEDVRWAVAAMNSELALSADAENEAAGMTQLLTRSLTAAQDGMEAFVKSEDPVAAMPDDFAAVAAGLERVAAGGKLTQQETDALNRIMRETGLTAEEVYGEAAELIDEQGEATAEAAERTAELAAAMGEVNAAFEGTAERVDALGSVLDELNAATPLAFADRAADTVQSFDDLKAALEEVKDIGSKPLAPTTVEDLRGLSDESAKVIDAMGGMRDAIQDELGAALADAGGNFDAFRDKATFFRDEITGQFTAAFTEMGLGPDEVDAKVTELLGNLGLLPSQVEMQIELTQAEEAIRKIELFGSAIGNLPATVQAQVAAAVDADDPIRAWELINAGVQEQGAVPVGLVAEDGVTPVVEEITGADYDPATIPLDADPADAEDERAGFVRETEATRPVVGVQASVAQALLTMAIINIVAKAMAPTVVVSANAQHVLDTLSAVQALRPRIPVEAYLSDYPTAAEIARAIGTVRVPVVAETTRIEGVR